MPGVLEALNAGRVAFRAFRWQEAFDALSGVDASRPLGAEDLEALGTSAWWLCRLPECLAARERALAAHLEADHPRQAAMVALALFFSSFRRGEAAIGAGWFALGERLLETEPEGREHGRFLRARAVLALTRGELDAALESARQAAALARRYEDRELVVLARYVEGCVRLKQGSVSAGMALLDEAMLAAMRGQLPPMVVGEVYCNLIDACYELGDLRRAGEWTEGLRRWSETHQPQSVYPGMCRVRHAGVLHLRGAWNEAEEEARRACGERLDMNPRVAAEGFYEIGEIRARTGDLLGAEEAFRRASELGREPQPGLGLMRLAQGSVDAAAAATAPDFLAQTTEGEMSFHEWMGDSWAVLFSHPKDFTPVCTTELGYMAKIKPEFDRRGVKIIGLSVDPVESHARWAGDIEETQGHAPNYPLIGDSDFNVSKLYGMLPASTNGDPSERTPADNQTVRNVFVIGPDKKIKLVLVYPMTTGRNFDEVLRVVDSLQLTAKHKVATPVNWQHGDHVIIAGSVSDDEAREKYPDGWESPRPYIRVVPQPNGSG